MFEKQITSKFSEENPELNGTLKKSEKWIVAYSGGVDSRVLLDLVMKSKPENTPLVVIHVNHGLSDNAFLWEEKVKEVCDSYGVELIYKRVFINGTAGVENLARDARYAAIIEEMTENSVVFTGHHLNDHAETFLFRLFRGSGVTGLCGIPKTRTLGQGIIFRPLLGFGRKEIESYAEHKGFNWVTDESNVDTKYSRNYIRHEVLPGIVKKWGNFLPVLNRTIDQLQEARDLLDEIAETDLVSISAVNKKHIDCKCISIEKLKKLSYPRMKNVLMKFCRDLEEGNQGSKRLDNLIKTIMTENKANSKLRVVQYEYADVVSNGNLVWIERK